MLDNMSYHLQAGKTVKLRECRVSQIVRLEESKSQSLCTINLSISIILNVRLTLGYQDHMTS